tara:strand:- start:122 stop:382 length:261 start_codon:yes stop_codon:yes gene_type:complete
VYLHDGNSEQPQKGPYFPERLLSLPRLQEGQGRAFLAIIDFALFEERSIVWSHSGYLEQPKKFPNLPVRSLISPSLQTGQSDSGFF